MTSSGAPGPAVAVAVHPTAAARSDPTDVLWQYDHHVLVFTRAGKPVFSQHGGEEQLSPLCALLQVLLHMQDDGGAARGGSPGPSPPSAPDAVRQVVFYRSLPTHGEDNAPVQALTLFFLVQQELMYVMAIRSVAPSPDGGEAAACGAEVHCTPPPVAGYCMAQLRHVHHCLLLVLPTVNTLLARTPGLDVMATYTSADRAALRELIESYDAELTYAAAAVATLSLSVEKRRVVEEALLRCYRACVDAAVGPPAHQLFSFLYFKSHLVAAVGPPEVYTTSAGVPPALGPDSARCGGLHVDDALLLYRYARSLTRRQVGEAWVPVCLPRFNSSGYLWCYAVNLTRHARELRQQQHLSAWPRVWEEGTEQDVLLLHVSAAQDDFAALSRCTRRFAQLLYAPAVGDNFYFRLEEELHCRAPAPLPELLSLSHVSRAMAGPHAASGRTGGVPLWYGLVLENCRPDFLAAAGGEELRAATAVVAAAQRALACDSASVRQLLESQPSPLLGLTTAAGMREFRLRTLRCQEQLRASPVPPSAPAMLFVRETGGVGVAVVHPTPCTLATLAQHYFAPHNPFAMPRGGADGAATGDDEDDGSTSGANSPATTRHGVPLHAWVEAVRDLGVVELTAVFAAGTPEAAAWYWVGHLLFMSVQRRGRFVLRQLIGAASPGAP